jgi:hypothetical protein
VCADTRIMCYAVAAVCIIYCIIYCIMEPWDTKKHVVISYMHAGSQGIAKYVSPSGRLTAAGVALDSCLVTRYDIRSRAATGAYPLPTRSRLAKAFSEKPAQQCDSFKHDGIVPSIQPQQTIASSIVPHYDCSTPAHVP